MEGGLDAVWSREVGDWLSVEKGLAQQKREQGGADISMDIVFINFSSLPKKREAINMAPKSSDLVERIVVVT